MYASSGHAEEGFDSEALRHLDIAEFERLYNNYAPELMAYLTHLCGEADTAQDLLQETFARAYRALPRTRPDLAPRPWLYKIATNTAHSTMRRAHWKRILLGSRVEQTPEPGENTFESRYAETEMVERALATIKPEYAAALLLHWREGFSIDELREILGLSHENLKKRLYRAKKAFITAYNSECAWSEGKEGGSL